MVTYSCERSEKKTSASAPSPGSTTSYSTSSPADRLGQRGDVERDRHPRRAHLHVLDERCPARAAPCRAARAPTACAIRPQFGSPPCSAAFTSGELATARAARRDDVVAARRGRRTRPIALGALAVAHDVQRELAQRPVQRLAEPASRPRVCGSTDTPDAPEAWRITVSLVESCPSTETRSNERSTHTPSSRSAVSADSVASVWTKQSIVANVRARSSRRPWPARSAARCRTAARRRPRPPWRTCPWCGSPRRSRRGRTRAAPPRARAMPRITSPASSSTPITPVEATATWSSRHAAGHRRRALHARRLLEAAVAGRRVGVAGVDDDDAQRVQPRALLGQHDRRGQHARAREARGAHAVGLPSRPSARRPSRREGLMPAATPAARKPCGQVAGVLGDVRRATPASVSSLQSLRFRPSEHQVQVLHRLGRSALPQVVDRREHDHRGPCAGRDATTAAQ